MCGSGLLYDNFLVYISIGVEVVMMLIFGRDDRIFF